MNEIKKYQPSNGTEGDIFYETYCMNCKHCDPHPLGDKQCEILLLTMIHNVTDPEYPSEWTYDKAGNPICTKFDFWDWVENGEPPEENTFVNPNQLTLF